MAEEKVGGLKKSSYLYRSDRPLLYLKCLPHLALPFAACQGVIALEQLDRAIIARIATKTIAFTAINFFIRFNFDY